MCHITISTPSEPASRMYSVWVMLRERDGILGHARREMPCRTPIDEAGAFALQLMRHAAGAVDDHAQILIESLHGACDGLPSLKQRAPVGRRILHHVHA